MEHWNVAKSIDLYGIQNWGDGYFDINSKGHVVVRPERNQAELDLSDFIDSLVQRGIEVPILIRFDGIIRDRVRRLQSAFDSAIKEFNYGGSYRAAYPIKVNQQRQVVDTIRQAGRDSKLGLEVGSKPELIAVMAMHDTPGALLLCNGYKDNEYIEFALMSKKVGRRPIIIIEQPSEVAQVIEQAEKLGVDAEIGLRMKPISKGAGHWEQSGGDKAKFGLSTHEIVLAIEELTRRGKKDWLKLLHYHAGSQITSIGPVKQVLREATRMYTEIAALCPSLCFFDVGGGLAVDYDGSKTNFSSSMNYTVEEYARDVVSAIEQACTEAKIPHPDIITESGRAMTAHSSVLVTQVIDVSPCLEVVQDLGDPPTKHEVLKEFQSMYRSVSVKNCAEVLHDAISLREDILERFIQGDINLLERSYAEKSFWHLMAKIKSVAKDLKYQPEDIEKLDDTLMDTFFCNFSVFQSLPDSWAIDHIFPIMPIHKLEQEPERRAVMADISCDSDGKIDRFIDLKDVKKFVRLHSGLNGHPYYVGIFLVGAYQEILGDLHNLFGDTNAVHVDVGTDGHIELTHVVEGDTVRDVLKYVEIEPQDLLERLRVSIEKALKDGTLSAEESAKIQKRYREALEGYTYLVA